MSWTHFLIQAVVAFDVFVLFYFLALNTSYLILFLVSLREVLRFVRRTFFSDYRQIMQSGMTWPISIVVAAHNEEKTIIATVRSLMMVSYSEFVAPGLVAVAAMNGAAFDSTFNFFYKLHYMKIYDAMLSTPLTLSNIVLGEVSWSVLRSSLYATVFLAIAAAAGLITSPWAVLMAPVALLIGVSISAIGIFSTTFIRNWHDFDYLSLALQVLFIGSATFYPIDVYPQWVQVAVNFTPLYHGVALCRDLAFGTIGLADLGHLGVLLAATLGFGLWARVRLEARLLD